jgi:hypothetical protein
MTATKEAVVEDTSKIGEEGGEEADAEAAAAAAEEAEASSLSAQGATNRTGGNPTSSLMYL